MPDTSEDPSDDAYKKGAILRAKHRRQMAIRWRNVELRNEDSTLKRLPIDWHDWMRCPADDGHGTRGCTCDEWQTSGTTRNSPKDLINKDRFLRSTLPAQLRISYKDRQSGVVAEADDAIVRGSIWVKTIDSPALAAMVSARSEHVPPRRIQSTPIRQQRAGKVSSSDCVDEAHTQQVCVSHRTSLRSANRWSGRTSVGRLGKRNRLRFPAWFISVGRYLPSLFKASR